MTTRKIRRPVGFNGEELNGYFMITNRDAATAILNKLTGSQLRLWLYLMMTDTYADFTRDGDNIFHPLPSPAEMAIKIGVSPDTVEKDMRKLKKLGLLPEWTRFYMHSTRNINQVERQICDRLQSEIGGMSEVSTPAGRIDLLTETEIIEVKNLKDWKAALGQILVYSAFYPEHQKRIHLFGNSNELKKLADIEIACLEFNIKVTGEVLQAAEVRNEKP